MRRWQLRVTQVCDAVVDACGLDTCFMAVSKNKCILLQAATGEDVTAEELGGAELHCTTSG